MAGCRRHDGGAVRRHDRHARSALPPTWSRANPVDIVGDAGARRYEDALAALLKDPGVDTILALNCPTGVSSPIEGADGLLAAWAKRPKYASPNLLACWLTASHAEAIRARFGEAGIPAFDTIESAIAGCAELAEIRPQPTPDASCARAG